MQKSYQLNEYQPNEVLENKANLYARNIIKSHSAQVNATLQDDYEKVLLGHCLYLPGMLCDKHDYAILESIIGDLRVHSNIGMKTWSKHFKHENPDISLTFVDVLKHLALYFDVDVFASRLNFYGDERAWKPFHHDSHAYVGEKKREDFTMGVSFGESRLLTFLHPPSGHTFDFPQHNGDVFAFTSLANKKFQHGVPKPKGTCGPRISLIAWGCRRSLNSRNCGKEELLASQNAPQKSLPQKGFANNSNSSYNRGNAKQNNLSTSGEVRSDANSGPVYNVSTIQIKEENQQDDEKPDMDVADAIALFENWIQRQKTLLNNSNDGLGKSLRTSNSGPSDNSASTNTPNESKSAEIANSKSAPTKSAGRGKSRVQGGWSGNRK